MRWSALPVVALAATAAQAQPTEILPGVELPAGITVEARASGDLNGDGIEDAAYVARNANSRALTVLLSVSADQDVHYRPEALRLATAAEHPGKLALDGGVLVFEDVTGGTTAISSNRRFRYDGRGKRMRLIGLEAKVYSPAIARDGFETSWNLLTGEASTRELRRTVRDGEAAYATGRERSFKRRIRPQWLSASPDPETVLAEMRED